MTVATRVPGIPRPPSSVDPETRQYLEALAEAVEIRLGRRGDPRDRAVTLRELIDSGLAKDLKARPFDPNNWGSSNIGFSDASGLSNPATPPAIIGLSVAGAYSEIILQLDLLILIRLVAVLHGIIGCGTCLLLGCMARLTAAPVRLEPRRLMSRISLKY